MLESVNSARNVRANYGKTETNNYYKEVSNKRNRRAAKDNDTVYYEDKDEKLLLKRREEISNELKELSTITDTHGPNNLRGNTSEEGKL